MSLALTYGKALYEAALEAKSSPEALDQIEKQIEQFITVIDSSKEVSSALLGPVVTGKEKATLVEEIMKRAEVAPIVARFLVLLARKRRLDVLREILEAYSTVRLLAEGGVSGRLVSAEPLSAGDLESLATAFSKKLGKKVFFRAQTDASLLAGVKVTVNGVTYDGSLRAQWQKLRDGLALGVN